MKPTIVFYLIALLSLLHTACRQDLHPEEKLSRIVFDAHGQQLITSSVNRQLGTMSILYGNPKAYYAALTASGKHIPGEEYTYVTWKYATDPLWDGSDINGELLCVETLHVRPSTEGADSVDYQVQEGTPPPVNGNPLSRPDRIAYIFDHRPSVWP